MSERHRFIEHIESLRDNRGALAALRRGLGQPPGTAAEQFRYVVPWLASDCSRQEEDAFYLIAGLFALHPATGGSGDIGSSMARARDPLSDNAAIERRFTALLAAHPEDLPFYLRQTVSFLRSRDVPVDWNQLLTDLRAWSHPDRYVQRRWARSYWGSAPESLDNTQED